MCVCVCVCVSDGWSGMGVLNKCLCTCSCVVFTLHECKLFVYLAVVVVYCLRVIAIVKPLGLISREGTRQVFITIIIITNKTLFASNMSSLTATMLVRPLTRKNRKRLVRDVI